MTNSYNGIKDFYNLVIQYKKQYQSQLMSLSKKSHIKIISYIILYNHKLFQ